MGSVVVSQIGYGFKSKDVYQQLRAEADIEYGHQQGYSGQINSTYGFREIKIATTAFGDNKLIPLNESGREISLKFRKQLLKYEDALIKRADDMGCLACVNLGIVKYIKITYKTRTLSKRKFDNYVLYTSDGRPIKSSRHGVESLNDYAEWHIHNTGTGVFIGGTLKNGSLVKVKEYEVKTVSTRRKPQNMNGCLPVYAFWFVGWASC